MLKKLRWLFVLLGLVVGFIALSPMLLYWYGLSMVDGRPMKPTARATMEEKQRVWYEYARETGAPTVPQMNPYGYAYQFVDESYRYDKGGLLARGVATEYLSEHRKTQGMAGWHLSGAALTIWVSRNWTEDEIINAAALGYEKYRQEKAPRELEK